MVPHSYSDIASQVLWEDGERNLFALEQVGMLLRYSAWYGLAPQAICAAWDAGQQRPTGVGLLIAGSCLGALYSAGAIFAARRVDAKRGPTRT